MSRRRRAARGFTLLEVLVALVVLSIGVLGVAKLTLLTVRSDDSAYLRTQATHLAYEILDQMRSNRAAAVGGSYTVGLTQAASYATDCNAVATCQPAEVAAFNLGLWKQQLAGALPSGDGAVTVAVGAAGQVTATIRVRWDDAAAQMAANGAAAGAAAPMDIVLVTLL